MHRSFRFRIIVLLVMLVAVFPTQVSARSMIDLDKDGSIVIDYNYMSDSNIDIPGADFRLYKVGDVDEYSQFEAAGTYKKYPIDYSTMKSVSDWNKLAYTLEGYIDADKIKPDAKAKTGADGTVKVNGIKPGLYLVLGGNTLYKNYIYTPVPTLVMLPQLEIDSAGKETNTWIYDVTMSPKVERKAKKDKVTIKVSKAWKNTDSVKHPDSVSINLYRDGRLFDTKEACQSNNWQCEWKDLDIIEEVSTNQFRTHRWSVSETSVKDYNVNVAKNRDNYVVTNTFAGTVSDDEKLPQTGMLWWPVPVLLCAGLILLIAGRLRERKD